MMRSRTLAASALGLAMLASCSSPPPPPPPTVVNITVTATADNNPTTDNVGAPLAMRIYQLGTAANFTGAEFFPLYNTDAAVLKSDIVQREDVLLAPGASKTETIKPLDTVKSIGFFGAYRDFQHTAWHASTDIEAHKTTNITVTAGRTGITVKAETLAPKPAP